MRKIGFLYNAHARIPDFDDFSNLADFSRKNAQRYRQTAFFIVIYVFELVFARKNLNRFPVRFLKKSTLAISSMSKIWDLAICQTSGIFSRKNRERYRQTVFFIVFYVVESTNPFSFLNHFGSEIWEKSDFSIPPMSEFQISTIFQTWPIFPGKTVRDIVKRFFLS